MNFTLAERAFLNMRLKDVLYPYNATNTKPNSNYFLEDIIFNSGKRIIIEQLRNRDDDIDEMWHTLNNHQCLLNDDNLKCWCSCNADT